METLEKAGYEAFFVGGYVRDKLWGKPVKDIDIATSARPEEVVLLFERTIPTGLKHGTVTVMMAGTGYEVTTYRKESDYADFRRPSQVEFISELQEDLRRRDFTMNAMAMDRTGQIRDPFGGQHDMKAGILRCVGAPEERFAEDALRMLRCIRFASTYGLQVDPATWQAMQERRELLRHVAMERVRVELERMMAGPDPYRGWQLALDSGLLAFTKEALSWPYATFEGNALSERLQAFVKLEDPVRRWGLLLAATSLKAKEVRELLRLLTFPARETERLAKLTELQEWIAGQDEDPSMLRTMDGITECSWPECWKLVVLRLGGEAGADWLAVEAAASVVSESPLAAVRLLLREGAGWMKEMPVMDMKELAVTGRELIEASGRGPGPWVGLVMTRLLRLAAVGRAANTKEALLAEALSSQ